MSIETADLNDGDIINGTRSEQVGADAWKLSYTLPSGAIAESTPFTSDNRRRAILGWVEYVKAAIVEDIAETAARKRRESMQAVIEDIPAALSNTAVPAALAVAPAAVLDPTAMIEAQIVAARTALLQAQASYDAALETKKAAEAAYFQWVRLGEALLTSPAPPQPADTAHGTSHADAAGCASPSRRKRRRAPQGTQSELCETQPQSAGAG
jgi:hypothetical protein